MSQLKAGKRTLTAASALCLLAGLTLAGVTAWRLLGASGSGKPVPTTIGPLGGREHPAPTGFGSTSLRIRDAMGQLGTWCALLADTEARRQQGLMWVTDPHLGGYDAMLFSFPADTTESFWMRNTPQPLSIAFFASDGRFVSAARMYPCGDHADCPSYSAAGPYRFAVEVPSGNLGRLGIGEGSSLASVGPKACEAHRPRR